MSGIKDIWLYANNIINSARQMVNEELRPLGLGSAEGNILLHLLTHEDNLRQDDLVEVLEISKAAVSRALLSLEKKGFVKRKKDREDKRYSRVLLSEKAHKIGPILVQIYENIFSFAAQGIPEDEIKNFIELFRRVSESFTQARKEKGKWGVK